ncbi:bis(5'-nucleosyl)-tetraphosphatase (symmetrical) YqeK [Aquibacillus koreensis]|uniref:bis(5'-nucleosyl)-tetraphosphatase (symmetrical) n=1 Tax=Aquibacillus koreensis TaxID=279446 RepID=A0A9X3WIP3_9BACI|nr:bis(5'-nucleosyl)-tetraphosphatase (symmetrical) YqeK [Aquibacillus koreensis]MCT2537630.1 bis(5'-nucleosyl)-tetraphosphatase (symmetrical) YqeK [Aquibacillus koreensis]MDC3419076.1 bis(5'-nucleosyl)-tetraphosphatase (symmetrical) YqeK [Aquibacillus koreensis]
MNREEALNLVEPHLKKTRFEHTKRVTDTAVDLAKLYNEDVGKVELAAVFHDYAKYRDLEEMRRWIISESLPKDLLTFHHELWHGPVGAILVKKEIGINDQMILNAIKYHTTGKKDMTKLEKIVYLADYIEPGRDFPGVDKVREQAEVDLDMGCFMATKNTIQFLLSKNQPIYPDTFHAYNDLLMTIKNKWREEMNG